MNIKEIIDAERWNLSMKNGWFEASHNDSLERIESAVVKRIAELTEVLSDIVLGTPIDDCNRNDDGLNAHPRNMERRIERAKSILKKEGGKW